MQQAQLINAAARRGLRSDAQRQATAGTACARCSRSNVLTARIAPWPLALAVIGACAGACLTGCGSGNSTAANLGASTPATTLRSATGSARITIQWPKAAANSRLIPAATNLIVVQMMQTVNGGTPTVVGTGSVAKPATGTSATTTIDSLPVGNLSVVATAYPGTTIASPGVALASGTSTLTIADNQTSTFGVTMASTIAQINLTAVNSGTTLPATLGVGGSLALTASAADASGNIVIASLQWTAANAASNPPGTTGTVASVDTSGNVSALLPGSAVVTATDPESGKSATTTVAVEQMYSATDIGNPGAGYVYGGGAALNASGQVVSNWQASTAHAFLYAPGSGFTDIGNVGGEGVVAKAVNDSGAIVGFSIPDSGVGNAFLYANGTITDISPATGMQLIEANAINASGQIVGEGAAVLNGSTTAFLYTNGTIQNLGTLPGGVTSSATGINSAGQVVGYSNTSAGTSSAFLYTGGTMTDLGTLGGTDSSATAINSAGEVVGNSETAGGSGYQAFVYTSGTSNSMVSLESLAGVTPGVCYANGVNDSGEIIGNFATTAGTDGTAYVYWNGAMESLTTVTTGLNGVSLDAALAITNTGSILASGADTSGTTHIFVLSPISGASKAAHFLAAARRGFR